MNLSSPPSPALLLLHPAPPRSRPGTTNAARRDGVGSSVSLRVAVLVRPNSTFHRFRIRVGRTPALHMRSSQGYRSVSRAIEGKLR